MDPLKPIRIQLARIRKAWSQPIITQENLPILNQGLQYFRENPRGVLAT